MRCAASIAELRKKLDTLDGWRFYPSRFTGYAGNTMEWHLASDKKDGKETNPAISKPLPDMELERFYRGWNHRKAAGLECSGSTGK